MSSRNDEIRRQLGSLLPLPQREQIEMIFSVRVIPSGDQRKQQDEQCDGDPSLLAVTDEANRHFNSFDEVLAWYDSEHARLER